MKHRLPHYADPLTPVEERLVYGIFRGMGYHEIAAEIGTTQTYLKHVFMMVKIKLGVRDRYDLIVRAFTSGGYKLWLCKPEDLKRRRIPRYTTAQEKREYEAGL